MSNRQFHFMPRLRTFAWTTACCTALVACTGEQGAVDVNLAPALDAERADTAAEGDYAPTPIAVTSDAGRAGLRLLPNATALPGDNYVLVRPAGGFGGRTSLGQLLRSAGALPAPFEYAIASDFTPIPGFGAGLSYLERTPAEGVTCVLAIGSTASGYGRPDSIIMRNCVQGDASLALAPIASLGAP